MAQFLTCMQMYERQLDKGYPDRQVCPVCKTVHYSDDSNLCSNCLMKLQERVFRKTPRR